MNAPKGNEEINGKVILLYSAVEEAHIGDPMIKDILLKNGIVPIACGNPNNFRFVVPEIIPATSVDLIGRLALQSLGEPNPVSTFGHAVRNALAPRTPPTTAPSKAKP